MKAFTKTKNLLFTLVCSLLMVSFAACSSDDDENPLAIINGAYDGKMYLEEGPTPYEEAEEAKSWDITATVNESTIELKNLPVKELLDPIINPVEPTANQAEENKPIQGETYKIGYSGKFADDGKSIKLTLNKEDLVVIISTPRKDGEENQGELASKITLKIEPENPAIANLENKEINMKLIVTEVIVGDENVKDFTRTTCSFKLTKK